MIKTQKEAAEKAGVNRWTLRSWEKKYQQLKSTDGGYDFNFLMLLAAKENPGIVKNIQADCHDLIGKINDPGPLLLIESLLLYFSTNTSLNEQQVKANES